ncbi:chemotaxis protein CheR [Rhodoferax lacus]|uniref:Chemotaxis protein CheR n=1 Tax=Rhodoferax lacus TaxID=2184758 RepID=A0A3E1RH41_9BURK|nr:chemotaxis protein CheB [Rhodoferax lacus]RFO98705.1 chemotaxis protein CheR [Rhodoferax lacus]
MASKLPKNARAQGTKPVAANAPAVLATDSTEVYSGASASFPIVGIGASAGGLAAFEAFFSGMPAAIDPQMAFVLVQHLAPNHESILADLIQRYTRMPVSEAVDGLVVKANCVYIIPPNHDMAILNGAIQLFDPSLPHGQRLPIDYFFRALAQDQGDNAIAIVLSGTGSDGTLGVRAIKGEGGLVLVQTPSTTEFDGMPRSAVATGLVDYQLAPAEMPARLIAYAVQTARARRLPASALVAPTVEKELNKVFVLLRAQTRHDFSLYKPGTLLRRIERRKALHQMEKLEDYVKLLQQTPLEVEALFRDLLIGVTNFVRDPHAFEQLEEQLGARLLAGKAAGERVRVWVPGCSTGEEAYSIAIALHERMQARNQNCVVQIFATDIDSQAIITARAGLYPTSIAADVSKERLGSFFTMEPGGGYRVRKVIRDMITFSEQDLIRDPPFSQLDLISCRNLLIYLRSELQQKLMQLFHYALNPGGILFLGSAESVGDFDNLFTVLDGKSRLYQRREAMMHRTLGNFLPPMAGPEAALSPRPPRQTGPVKYSLGEQTERALLLLLAPACALVEKNGDILHLRGRTGNYLEPTPGDSGVNNIVKMAREGLTQALKLALHQSAQEKMVIRRLGLRVRTNGHFSSVNLTVSPVVPRAADVYQSTRFLVVMEESPLIDADQPLPDIVAMDPAVPTDVRVAALERELRDKEKLLRSAHEDTETSTEELRSAIEEMQSVNEELQASNEELATSKEELQSVNEELATVNVEQQNKVADLARALNDNRNLLAGSGIATVFVDLQQRILSFTPSATAIIKLVASDVGRPLGHFMARLRGYDRMTEDIATVLDTLATKEIRVQDKDGRWYMLRILPYRTLENVIEGAAVTFMDISEVVKAQVDIAELHGALDALKESEQRFRSVVSALSEGVLLYTRDGKIAAWNPSAERILGLSGQEIQERSNIDPRWDAVHEDGSPCTPEAHPSQIALRTGLAQQGLVMGMRKPGGAVAWVSVSAVPIFEPGEPGPSSVVVSFSDITERRLMQGLLDRADVDTRLAMVLRDAHDAMTIHAKDGRILAWNPAAERIYGWTEAEALHMNLLDRVIPAEREQALQRMDQLGRAVKIEPCLAQRLAKDGSVREVSITATALRNEAGDIYAIATTERLVTRAQPH